MMNMDVDKCLVLVFRCYGFEIKFFEKEITDRTAVTALTHYKNRHLIKIKQKSISPTDIHSFK